jgi:3-phosphoshikimate 1-carboxyvinyltransferase
MFGALAEGITEITGFLPGEDCLATLKAFRAMGVDIEHPQPDRIIVQGAGLQGLKAPEDILDMGNSGTAMRLLTGIMVAQSFDSILSGDNSLNRRPMRRITDPLSRMGALIETTADGTAPLHIKGGRSLHGIDYSMPVASAQVKSCMLFAGLYADGVTAVYEPAPTRDHTERMLESFGYPVKRENSMVIVQGGGRLQAGSIRVPGDISSAAFFLVAASIAKNAELLLKGVGINPTRIGVIAILREMGADITLLNQTQAGSEPIADILVRSAPLKGIRIPPELVPLAIDEFPALFVAAAAASGETVLTDAAELRVKESDRIQVMADGLQILGIDARPAIDGIVIQGGKMHGGEVDSHGDHRIAMAFAMAGFNADGVIRINDCANVNTSFPGFVDLAHYVGLAITSYTS